MKQAVILEERWGGLDQFEGLREGHLLKTCGMHLINIARTKARKFQEASATLSFDGAFVWPDEPDLVGSDDGTTTSLPVGCIFKGKELKFEAWGHCHRRILGACWDCIHKFISVLGGEGIRMSPHAHDLYADAFAGLCQGRGRVHITDAPEAKGGVVFTIDCDASLQLDSTRLSGCC